MEFIHRWASAKLIPVDADYDGTPPTIGDLYKDFKRWAEGKPLLLEIPATTFGRHIRNLAGIEVKRKSHGAIAVGVRLMRMGDQAGTFEPKLRLIRPNLTKLEEQFLKDRKKTQRQTALEISFAALTLIAHSDQGQSRQIAENALMAIQDTGHRKRRIIADQRATQMKKRKGGAKVLKK